jgi:hypothetical protein
VRLLRTYSVTIIPLAPASRPGSSDLPEGCPSALLSPRNWDGVFFRRYHRAGPALPSYLVLHHAGFAMPAPLLAPRWALTPPFHPYLRRVPFEDIPKVFLRAITGIRSAGGIFSVALSVNSSTGFSPRFGCAGECRILAVKTAQTQVRATAPLALPGALPNFALAKWCPDFPPAQPASAGRTSDHPAHPPFPLYCPGPLPTYTPCECHFVPINFSNSPSVNVGTPNSFAFSYFDPGSVPTTT